MLTEVSEGLAICCYGCPEELKIDHELEYYFTLMVQGVVYKIGLNWDAISLVNEVEIAKSDLQDQRVEILRLFYDIELLAVAIAQRFINELARDHEVEFVNFEYLR